MNFCEVNRSLFVPAEKNAIVDCWGFFLFFFSPHIHCGWFTFWENSAFFTVQGETKRVLFGFLCGYQGLVTP